MHERILLVYVGLDVSSDVPTGEQNFCRWRAILSVNSQALLLYSAEFSGCSK